MRNWLLAVALLLPTLVQAQAWSGVITAPRAIDWSTAGVIGGIPSSSWTQCGATVAGGTSGSPTSTATIQAAITACTANHYVQLGAGYFSTFCSSKNSVAIRGLGADQTFITGAGSNCQYYTAMVTLTSGSLVSYMSPSTTYNWTGGLSKGSATLTISGTAGITPNSTLIMLDQCDDGFTTTSCTGSIADTGNYFVCSNHPCISSSEDQSVAYRTNRAEEQIVMPTAAGGGTITIPSPGVESPQWRSAQSPQAWIIGTALQFSGLENLSIDTTASGAEGINLDGCYNCWVSGVRILIPASKTAIHLVQVAHSTIQNNYYYGSTGAQDAYGIYLLNTSDNLIINNISHQDRGPIVFNAPASGDVVAYNFAVGNQPGSGWWSYWHHNAGIAYILYEGNVASGVANDDIHGSHNMITQFRNYYFGYNESNATKGGSSQVNPDFDGAFTRYSNVVGNILGNTVSAVQTAYSSTDVFAPSNTPAIYIIGAGNGIPTDTVSATTMFRWGNWDAVTNASRFCTDATSPCTGSEVPSGIGTYPNSVPGSHTLPNSFFLASKPAWWTATIPYPANGPDVSSGTISGVGGHANMNPAMNCYLNVMGGPANGTGSVLTFNASTCYAAAPPPPAPGTVMFVMAKAN